jgi:NAD kinase
LGLCKHRELTELIVKDYDIPVSRACKLTSLPRKMYYYKSQKDYTALNEALIDTSLSSKRIIIIMEIFILERRKQSIIRTDIGPEFTSKDLELWATIIRFRSN